MFVDVRRDEPSSSVDSSHAGTRGAATYDAQWRHPVPILWEHLPIKVNGEELWCGAHAQEMPADWAIGTDTQTCGVWGEGDGVGGLLNIDEMNEMLPIRYQLNACRF